MRRVNLFIILCFSFLLVLYGCEEDTTVEDDNIYVIIELNSNRGNIGYKKGEVVSYSVDRKNEKVYVVEFFEDGNEFDSKEENVYILEDFEENEDELFLVSMVVKKFLRKNQVLFLFQM